MREKYESLSLATLRDLAKARGLKSVSALRKGELIDRMVEEDEKEAAQQTRQAQPQRQAAEEPAQPQQQTHQPPQQTQRPARQTAQQVHRQAQSPARQNMQQSHPPRQPAQMNRHEQETEYQPVQRSQQPVHSYENQPMRQQPRMAQEPDAASAQRQMPHAQTYRTNGNNNYRTNNTGENRRIPSETAELDSGEKANGILEVLPDGYGFIRCENYMPGENDIYVSPSQIRRFNLKTGDILQGNIRIKTQSEKFSALLYVTAINGYPPEEAQRRKNFEDMTPIFPNERIRLERPGGSVAMRIVDLISPIGKGQRGMIVSPPKAGKTTLLKDVAKSILRNKKEMHLIILLIDERPEEVTDIKEAIQGPNVEVIYSTFDEQPEHHKRVSEMVIERARRLVEHGQDVTILLDSITRLARAYNICIQPSGRTLSGGLDPAALHMPKRFFGAARNMREGGSLTILATALVDTGSKMDDVIYEEFKGTGNMELVLDRKLQERRVFPAIDIQKSGTRREDLLLSPEEQDAVNNMRRALNSLRAEDAVEQILNMFSHTKTNGEFVHQAQKQKFI